MNNNCNDIVEPTVSEKEMYTGKYISLKVMTVEKNKGYAQKEIVEHKGTIMVIPITQDDKVVMDRIYRKTVELYSCEIPTKTITSSENHIDIIKYDILEKLGYDMIDIRHLFDFYPALSYSDEKVFLYIARVMRINDVEFCKSCSTIEMPIDMEDIKKLDIIDAKTMLAINYIKEKRDNVEVEYVNKSNSTLRRKRY